MGQMKWQEIIHRHEIDALAQGTTPVLFFKHSARCPVCVMALKQIEAAWTMAEYDHIKPCIIHVREARAASDHLAKKFDITHASPQAIVIHHNQVLYHASHEDIDYMRIKQALPSD